MEKDVVDYPPESPSPQLGSVEGYFATRGQTLERAHALVKRLAKFVRSAQKSAGDGNVAMLEKSVADAQAACLELSSTIGQCAIDRNALAAAVGTTSFLDEIANLGSSAGIDGLRVTEGRLAAFPYVLEPPSSFTLTLGSTKLRSIRPSIVAAEIVKSRQRSAIPQVKLIEAIGRVCERFSGGGEAVGVSLFDVYDSLTPLPGQQSSYTIEDFFAGVCKLSASGPHYYRDALLDFPAPGSGARRVKTMVGPDGRQVRYSTVRLLPMRQSAQL